MWRENYLNTAQTTEAMDDTGRSVFDEPVGDALLMTHSQLYSDINREVRLQMDNGLTMDEAFAGLQDSLKNMNIVERAMKTKYLRENPSKEEAYGSEHELDMEVVLEWFEERDRVFFEQADGRSAEIEGYFAGFKESALQAVRTRGLPLTEEQVVGRLDRVKLTFTMAQQERLSEATYDNQLGVIYCDPQHSPEQLERYIYHEAMHALSGARMKADESDDTTIPIVKRVGLMSSSTVVDTDDSSRKHQRGVARNEAFTDMFANILLNKVANFRFDASGEDSYNAFVLLVENADLDIYGVEKSAYLSLHDFVDMRLISDAFFKADFDEHEQDDLAGVHAERELQRAIKMQIPNEKPRDFQMRVEQGIEATNYDDEDRARELKALLNETNQVNSTLSADGWGERSARLEETIRKRRAHNMRAINRYNRAKQDEKAAA